LLQKEGYEVVGCAIDVLNARGHGLHENSTRRDHCELQTRAFGLGAPGVIIRRGKMMPMMELIL
jgi:hypothetical protein